MNKLKYEIRAAMHFTAALITVSNSWWIGAAFFGLAVGYRIASYSVNNTEYEV